MDGKKEVEFYTAQGVDIGWAQHEKTMKSWNATDCGPAKKIARLAQAQASGAPVQSALQHKSELVMMESGKYSLSAMRSAVRSWCAFMTSVLGTEPQRSIPPVSSGDVLKWLAVFKVFGTALNYEAHLHKFCVLANTGTAWRNERMALWRKGARSLKKRQGYVNSLDQTLLDHDKMISTCVNLQGHGEFDIMLAAVLSWWFRLRIPSETVGLRCGDKQSIDKLPEDWLGAVALVDGELHIRLGRRKHRPRGSLMVRKCSAAGTHALARRTTSTHRFW